MKQNHYSQSMTNLDQEILEQFAIPLDDEKSITYNHHKQRIKDYKSWIRVNEFRLKVCGDHQIKGEKLREKHERLIEKLELYKQHALQDGHYELVI